MASKPIPVALRRRLRRAIEARGDRDVSAETRLSRLALAHAVAGMPVVFGTRALLERHFG